MRPLRPVFRLALTLALTIALAPHALRAQDAPPLRVTTSLGALDGRDSAGVARWLGIPFAAPPVGALRWKAPMAPVRWSGPRDASAFGPTCVQTDRLAKMYGGPMDPISEDCLTLNVWSASPSGATTPR